MKAMHVHFLEDSPPICLSLCSQTHRQWWQNESTVYVTFCFAYVLKLNMNCVRCFPGHTHTHNKGWTQNSHLANIQRIKSWSGVNPSSSNLQSMLCTDAIPQMLHKNGWYIYSSYWFKNLVCQSWLAPPALGGWACCAWRVRDRHGW